MGGRTIRSLRRSAWDWYGGHWLYAIRSANRWGCRIGGF